MTPRIKITFSDGSEAAEVETVGRIKPTPGFVTLQFIYKSSGLPLGAPFPMSEENIQRQKADGRIKITKL